mmetsp:Transcript_31571/g.84343  ORF Transcript_31571/g.84343 Transcript_31571/m.84343 type:complete len:337 (-) Transcript_31571:842-1852(-)
MYCMLASPPKKGSGMLTNVARISERSTSVSSGISSNFFFSSQALVHSSSVTSALSRTSVRCALSRSTPINTSSVLRSPQGLFSSWASLVFGVSALSVLVGPESDSSSSSIPASSSADWNGVPGTNTMLRPTECQSRRTALQLATQTCPFDRITFTRGFFSSISVRFFFAARSIEPMPFISSCRRWGWKGLAARYTMEPTPNSFGECPMVLNFLIVESFGPLAARSTSAARCNSMFHPELFWASSIENMLVFKMLAESVLFASSPSTFPSVPHTFPKLVQRMVAFGLSCFTRDSIFLSSPAPLSFSSLSRLLNSTTFANSSCSTRRSARGRFGFWCS